jgi:hypothetical protein
VRHRAIGLDERDRAAGVPRHLGVQLDDGLDVGDGRLDERIAQHTRDVALDLGADAAQVSHVRASGGSSP